MKTTQHRNQHIIYVYIFDPNNIYENENEDEKEYMNLI